MQFHYLGMELVHILDLPELGSYCYTNISMQESQTNLMNYDSKTKLGRMKHKSYHI
jgi:hypothetical protein